MSNTKKSSPLFGTIWRVPDESIWFPIFWGRTHHKWRPVVIIENSTYNNNSSDPSILIAPLSHDLTNYHQLDVKVQKSSENNLNSDSYIRMKVLQCILKQNLKEYIGELSSESKDAILASLEILLNIDVLKDVNESSTTEN